MRHQSDDGREVEEARTVGPQPRHDREGQAFAALARFDLTPAPPGATFQSGRDSAKMRDAWISAEKVGISAGTTEAARN